MGRQIPLNNDRAKCFGMGNNPHYRLPDGVRPDWKHPFFPDRSNGWVQEMKHFCNGTAPEEFGARCEMKDECLQYALDNDEKFGVWGGTSERERRRMRNARREQEGAA